MGNSDSFDLATNKYEAINYAQVKERLENYGVCYIPNILTDEERIEMISGTWDFFEHLTQNDDVPIRRENSETWKYITSCTPINDMLFHYWNAGHSQHSWNIRQNPNVVSVFAELWNCAINDLLVSFDGFGFLLPPENTNEGWQGNTERYHLDQSLYRTHFDGVQGFVTAYDIDDGDATLAFLEGSNNYMNEFIEKFGIISETDWVPFEKEHIDFFKSKCLETRMKCPSKSLVLWDSRTVHCGSKPLKNRSNNNTRCISYVSYSPKNRITDQKLKEKIIAFEALYTSNHYAHNPIYFPTLPNGHDGTTDEYVVPINPPILTNLGRSLVGYVDTSSDTISSDSIN